MYPSILFPVTNDAAMSILLLVFPISFLTKGSIPIPRQTPLYFSNFRINLSKWYLDKMPLFLHLSLISQIVSVFLVAQEIH